MAADKDHSGSARIDVARLKAVMDAFGWTQAELALRLGTTQPTISKLLAHKQNPRPALRAAVRQLMITEHDGEAKNLIEQVAAAASRSEAFRALLTATLSLMNENE